MLKRCFIGQLFIGRFEKAARWSLNRTRHDLNRAAANDGSAGGEQETQIQCLKDALKNVLKPSEQTKKNGNPRKPNSQIPAIPGNTRPFFDFCIGRVFKRTSPPPRCCCAALLHFGPGAWGQPLLNTQR